MRTTKTDKILNLFGKDNEQPDVTAGHLSNPSFRVPDEKEVSVIFEKTTPGFQLINVGFLLINEQLGQVMERFNCCMCEKCAAAITSEVLKRVPPLFVEVRRISDAEKVNRLGDEWRSEVRSVLTKAVIGVKNNPRHITK